MRYAMFGCFVLVAACGGKSNPAAGPSGGGARVAAPGAVVGDGALYAKAKASTIALPAGDASMPCDGYPTLGEAITAWEGQMGGPIKASCDEGKCYIELATPIDPACDANQDDGCDGSAYTVEFALDGAGEIDPATLMCMSAG